MITDDILKQGIAALNAEHRAEARSLLAEDGRAKVRDFGISHVPLRCGLDQIVHLLAGIHSIELD